MVTRSHRRVLGVVLALATVLASCGGDSGPTTTVAPDTTPPSATPEIVVAPEFVNGAVPGSRLVLLVRTADDTAGEVSIAAEADGADVSVAPDTIARGEVAEVTIVPDPTDTESDIEVRVSGTAGGGTDEVVRPVTVVPWEDDRGDQARAVLDLFLPWLAEQHPEFELSPETEFVGTMTAPLLLIVSHYGFYSDAWEVGVSWHVMVPPDDFAELYLRPRGGLAPTHAFRIESWQTALETGVVEVTEVEPPLEVVR